MAEIGFRITIDVGQMKTNFLDVTLDLSKGSYSPFRKPNSKILYINSKSNHPMHIKKALPGMIEKRLNSLSKSEKDFSNCKQDYELALENSGHNTKLKFDAMAKGKKKKSARKRKCIFFNPPYCQSVKQNIGKAFLRLVDEYFDKDHHYRKIFNRSTIKISYCCMQNMKSKIQAHNKKILSNNNMSSNTQSCNCRRKNECPLDGQCMTKDVIYDAVVKVDGEKNKRYIGSTGNDFKSRYYGHTRSFRDESGKNSTELSKYIWKVKGKGKQYQIKWNILERNYGFDGTLQKMCRTCNREKIHIANADRDTTLNTRSELVSMCRHHTKLYFPKLSKRKLKPGGLEAAP